MSLDIFIKALISNKAVIHKSPLIFTVRYTVKPVYNGHSQKDQERFSIPIIA